MALRELTWERSDEGAGPRGDGRRPRRPSRRVVVGAAVAVILAAAVLLLARGGGDTSSPSSVRAATKTAEVVRRDLVVTDTYEGALGFGEPRAYVTERAGVVTSVAEAGKRVRAGELLFSVDLEPTVVLTGPVPAYRALSTDSTGGPDIAQLEQGLVELGFGPGLSVDEVFDSATASAVASWEEALGRATPDGVVSVGDVVFSSGPVRVASVKADVGTRLTSGATVIQATPSTQVVTVDLEADRSNQLEPGTSVKLTLPGGNETTGTVAVIGVQAEAQGQANADPAAGGQGAAGGPTVPVTITVDDPAAAASFDTGSVDVAIERSRDDDATAVPVTALVALAEGGYALQVVDESRPGGYRLVGVEVGTFADGFVGVSADGLEPGSAVMVPA